MKKVSLFSYVFSMLFFLAGSISAQDPAKANKKTTTKNTASTTKSDENKKSPSTTIEPAGVTAPAYTPRTATSVEPKKKLPKSNSVSGAK